MTYDRVSIQKWLKSGNLICPKTGEKLATTELVPNLNRATLSESFDGSDTMLKSSSLPLILKTLQTSSPRAAKEYCVSILLALCNNLGNEVILANNTNLIGFLYTLSTNGGSQGAKKARTLIRIMYRFHETNSSGLMANCDSSRIAAGHSC
ncbi:putative U box domain, Zinc finger, RING/FYVE/PHD-type [Helianthus debilis subsp. tardiflorus]